MASTTFNDILNFIIPIGVWLFIIWIIYRIPIVTEGVAKLKNWWENKREAREEAAETSYLKNIEYE